MCEDSLGMEYEAHDEEEKDGDSDLSFSIFDVTLLTGLHATRKAELDGDKVTIDVRQIVCGRMAEWEMEEMVNRYHADQGRKGSSFVTMCLLRWYYAMRTTERIRLGCAKDLCISGFEWGSISQNTIWSNVGYDALYRGH